jgi:hypothetical protein
VRIFEDRGEEFTCFLPFMREGIEAGEKAFHIVDPALRDDHLERLRRAGIATDETQRTGQLQVRGWDEAYLRGGHFDQEATLSLIREILDRARAQGYPRTRLNARAEWALQGLDSSAIVAYEALLNGQLQVMTIPSSAPTTPQGSPARPSSTFCARIRRPSSGASPARTPSSRLLRSSWSSCFRGNTDAGGTDPPPGFDAPSGPVLPRRPQ